MIDRLIERYSLKVVLVGSAQTVPMAAEVLQRARQSPEILDLTGKTSLAQMVSLLRRARLLISNDSGPVHVAAGVGISVISLFLRDQPGINAGRWKPLGPKSFILSNTPAPFSVEDVMELADRIFQANSQYEIF